MKDKSIWQKSSFSKKPSGEPKKSFKSETASSSRPSFSKDFSKEKNTFQKKSPQNSSSFSPNTRDSKSSFGNDRYKSEDRNNRKFESSDGRSTGRYQRKEDKTRDGSRNQPERSVDSKRPQGNFKPSTYSDDSSNFKREFSENRFKNSDARNDKFKSFKKDEKPEKRERIKPERENPRKKTWETRQVGEKRMPNFETERLIKHLSPKLKEKIEAKKPVSNTIRLNRYIANAGLCSRREADDFIVSGQITVNGKVITEMGYKVLYTDVIKYGRKILNREKIVYLLLNKPKDFLTTTDDPEGRKTVMDLVKNACEERIYPIGRLDRATTGLLLMTNDGELADKLAHPSNNIKKIYQVEINKPITSEDFEKIMEGLTLEDGFVKPDALSIITPDAEVLGIEIHSGKNRIVRRIFEHLGYEVMKLDRTTYAGLTKKELPRGNWRFLTEKEVIRLKYLI